MRAAAPNGGPVSGFRIVVLLAIPVLGLLLVVLLVAGIHQLRAALIGFAAGVIVARAGPHLWHWAVRRDG